MTLVRLLLWLTLSTLFTCATISPATATATPLFYIQTDLDCAHCLDGFWGRGEPEREPNPGR